MNSQIENLIQQALADLKCAQVETSVFEIKFLLAEVLQIEVGQVMAYSSNLTPQQVQQFEEFVRQRRSKIPADKIIGHRGFYKHEFLVNTDVLSPRPDTEILVEAAISAAQKKNAKRILELGVGSGCVIVSILADCPNVQGVGIDISSAALKTAAQNAQKIGVENRLQLLELDWFAKTFLNDISGKFDIIVSNPPYITTADIAKLDSEVKEFDPMFALDGGADGLESYRRLAEIVPSLLVVGGMLFLEVGETQADDVQKIFVEGGLQAGETLTDLNGIKRCVILKK